MNARLLPFCSEEDAERWPRYREFGGILSKGDWRFGSRALCPSPTCQRFFGIVTALWYNGEGGTGPRSVLCLPPEFGWDERRHEYKLTKSPAGHSSVRRKRPLERTPIAGDTASRICLAPRLPPSGVAVNCDLHGTARVLAPEAPVTSRLHGNYWHAQATRHGLQSKSREMKLGYGAAEMVFMGVLKSYELSRTTEAQFLNWKASYVAEGVNYPFEITGIFNFALNAEHDTFKDFATEHLDLAATLHVNSQ